MISQVDIYWSKNFNKSRNHNNFLTTMIRYLIIFRMQYSRFTTQHRKLYVKLLTRGLESSSSLPIATTCCGEKISSRKSSPIHNWHVSAIDPLEVRHGLSFQNLPLSVSRYALIGFKICPWNKLWKHVTQSFYHLEKSE